MTPRLDEPITSIICAPSNPFEQDSARTVSLCIFAGSGNVPIDLARQGFLKN